MYIHNSLWSIVFCFVCKFFNTKAYSKCWLLLYRAEPNLRIKFNLSMTFETIQVNGLN